MRLAGRGLSIAVLILLAAAHVAYWYLPREHARSLRPGSGTATVFENADLPFRAWIAHPHQNLGFLESGLSGERWREGLAKLLGVPELEVPDFGPFALPPAAELALATDEKGERLILAARIYPAVAAIARLAGSVANNPWLAGGRLEEGGRLYEVEWRSGCWMLRTSGESWPASSEPSKAADGLIEASPPAIAWIGLSAAAQRLPAGRYRIERRDGHLDLLSPGAAAGDLQPPERGLLMMIEGGERERRATAILGPGEGSLRGVPSAVTLARNTRLAPLPFERLYRVLGVRRRRGEESDWKIAASDRLALERGRELVPRLERLVAASAPAISYTADLDVVRAVSRELERRLEGIPLPRIEEIERWRGAALLLEELAAYDRWSFEVGVDGTVRSRLWLPAS